MTATPNPFHHATPILRVRDLAASLDHYQRVLGFKLNWETQHMVSVSRGDACLMLCHGHQGRPRTWVWIGVADADALEREYRASGAAIRLPPTNYTWAYEMHVEDPDGHVIRLGSDPKADRPFSEWVTWYPVDENE
jgi:catechol 2,3-dioxygenase-like lactoylglutathione lyase family enzyme